MWFVFAAVPKATGIVVLLRPGAIYVAADSAVLNADLKLIRADLCKIVPGRKVVFALAGTTAGRFAQRNLLTGETRLGDSFNLFDLAKKAVQAADTRLSRD
jgi:ATP-dependent protease HslVU (ClpYQ) peptidase subunit